MQEIRLVGDISSVELAGGTLTITIDGQPLVFPVGEQARPAPAPRQRQPRKTNGHAEEPAGATGAEE